MKSSVGQPWSDRQHDLGWHAPLLTERTWLTCPSQVNMSTDSAAYQCTYNHDTKKASSSVTLGDLAFADSTASNFAARFALAMRNPNGSSIASDVAQSVSEKMCAMKDKGEAQHSIEITNAHTSDKTTIVNFTVKK